MTKYLVEVNHQQCPDWYYKSAAFWLDIQSWRSPVERTVEAMSNWGPF